MDISHRFIRQAPTAVGVPGFSELADCVYLWLTYFANLYSDRFPMNIFYAPPDQISSQRLELRGQEAHHATRVLRKNIGDEIAVVDGEGGWYDGKIETISRQTVGIGITSKTQQENLKPILILGIGILKKRDRLEFAVEKAVELGVSRIALFRSRHTVKENVRTERLETITLGAMKQSLRARLPSLEVYDSLRQLLDDFKQVPVFAAHEKGDGVKGIGPGDRESDRLVLLVGPEGGFSEEEIGFIREEGGKLISLGDYRLRTETAVVALLSQFI